MPLLQYFGWVGSFLFAALLAANCWFSAPIDPTQVSDVPLNQKINIRIHSDHKWPERVVFDMTRSKLAPEATADAALAQTERGPFDAFAQMPAIRARLCFRPPCPVSQAAEGEGGLSDNSRQFKNRSGIAERKGLTFPNRPHKPPGRS